MNQKTFSKNAVQKTLWLCLLALSILPATSWASEDLSCGFQNARFGFVLYHPCDLIKQPPPDNGDGIILNSQDKKFELVASGLLNASEQNLSDLFQQDLKEYQNNVVYKKKSKTWYVVSWLKDEKVFYKKVHFKNGVFISLYISYPKSQKNKWDKTVAKIEKKFVAFPKSD